MVKYPAGSNNQNIVPIPDKVKAFKAFIKPFEAPQ